MSKSSRPRVYTRLRPLNQSELTTGDGKTCFYPEKGTADVLICEKEVNDKVEHTKTRFDRVFDTTASQDDIFNTIGTEVMSTLFSGYNASVFCYGQTSAGKTYTMEGDMRSGGDGSNKHTDRGLIPRSLDAIFQKFNSSKDITDAKVEVSMVQIYQERVQDLLQQRRQLEIHLDRTGQYIAQHAAWRTVRSAAQALQLFQEGSSQRATNATEMNLVSSRSHSILMLRLQWDEPSLPGSHAQLNLVDLAGSEKLYQSGATGEVMKETIAINKSLSALGNVVSKLVDASRQQGRSRVHVPYKDSKLTYLLQSSLGGSNLVHFILAMSPSLLYRAESQSTIEFGKRALQLVLKPVRNPIDYKRLEEMEAMIETMRNRIRNLEDELNTRPHDQPGGGAAGAAGAAGEAFLQMKRLQQEGDELTSNKRPKQQRPRAQTARTSRMRSRAELSRIIANLPETLEDLTSHCILFPNSREDFRNLGGLEKLVHLIDRSPSTFYRAHAAHTVAHVIDDEGRIVFASCGGIEVVERLLLVREERCKEAACAALEAAVRSSEANKLRVTRATYEAIVELTYGYPNQQVQEAACTALATLVDGNPACRPFLGPPVDAVKKLLLTIKEAPEEVVHVTKAAATCIGRLAHGDAAMQAQIRQHGGVHLLIDHVLFSSSGDRDHQVPILASYALVNLCCSNAENMRVAQQHPRYDEVRFRLMEGLARAFGNNTVREAFARATASETASPFPYHGITVTDKWSSVTCGGRPIFSSFHENPQFFLYVEQDTNVSLMIQDTLYESRMQQKLRNATVYMGLAVFQGETELANAGLKQLDFHGKMVEIARFTSNCENVLHCTLKKSEAPYIVVPFASQRGRQTNFALSAFGDKPMDLIPIPETTGWCRRVVHGAWTAATAGGGDTLLWRNNPQVLITARENTKVVFVLSYLSLDFQRCSADRKSANSLLMDDGASGFAASGGGTGGGSGGGNAESEEKANTRPRMHGRLYRNNFAPEMRYAKHFAALPTSSSFVAGNTYSSNSYVTVAANLKAGESYAFVPFTESPVHDTFRLCVFTVSDEVDVKPLRPENEWKVSTIPGVWAGEQLRLSVRATGKMSFVVSSAGVILRASVFSADQKQLFTPESLFSGETWVDLELPGSSASQPCTIIVEGFVRPSKDQPPSAAVNLPFTLITYLQDADGLVSLLPAENSHSHAAVTISPSRAPLILGTAFAKSLANNSNNSNNGSGNELISSLAESPGAYPVAVAEDADPLDVASAMEKQSAAGHGASGAHNFDEDGNPLFADDFDSEDDDGNLNNNSSCGGAGGASNANSGALSRAHSIAHGGAAAAVAAAAEAAVEVQILKEKNGMLSKTVDSLTHENASLRTKLAQVEAQLEQFKNAAMMNTRAQAQYSAALGSGSVGSSMSSMQHQQHQQQQQQRSAYATVPRPHTTGIMDGGGGGLGGGISSSSKTPTLPATHSQAQLLQQQMGGYGVINNGGSGGGAGVGSGGIAARMLSSNSGLSINGNNGGRREITPLGIQGTGSSSFSQQQQQQQHQQPPNPMAMTLRPPMPGSSASSLSGGAGSGGAAGSMIRAGSAAGRPAVRPSSSSSSLRRYSGTRN